MRHVLASELERTDSFNEIFIFTESFHHDGFVQELVLLWANQDLLETEHPSYVPIQESLILVNIVTHL